MNEELIWLDNGLHHFVVSSLFCIFCSSFETHILLSWTSLEEFVFAAVNNSRIRTSLDRDLSVQILRWYFSFFKIKYALKDELSNLDPTVTDI